MRLRKKIVFLDIDGVLQPFTQYRFNHDMDMLKEELAIRYGNEYLTLDKYDLAAVYYDWNKDAIDNLRSLLLRTGADIVISSAWREGKTIEEVRCFFRMYDLAHFVVDFTPELELGRRHEEISAYLESNKHIEEYVIIDDIDLGKYFPNNFVQTSSYFNKKAYIEALRIMGETHWYNFSRVSSEKVPRPFEVYSSATIINNMVYTSYQLPITKYGDIISDEFEEQVEQIIKNLKLVLEESKSVLERVVKANVYLKDLGELASFNNILKQHFNSEYKYPSITCVEVSNLPKNSKVAIDVIAAML